MSARSNRLSVAEAVFVAACTAVVVPFFLGVWSIPDLLPGVLNVGLVQLVIVGVVSAAWFLLPVALCLKPCGRAYLSENASRETADINIQTRQDSLTIAGLVLAGLALGPTTLTRSATAALVAAFASFIIVWAAGFLPYRTSTTVVGDALHWTGLGCVLAAVYAIANSAAPDTWGPRLAIVLASVFVASYSCVLAYSHWEAAQKPLPPENRPSEPGPC